MNYNLTYTAGEYKCIVLERLREADISTDRAVKLKQGTKRPKNNGWQSRNLPNIEDINGHFGIRCGDKLIVLDVDDWTELSEQLKKFIEDNPTLTVRSPHTDQKPTGRERHYYYKIDTDINNNPPGCDIQGPGSIVADGARVWGIRDGKDCSYRCCSKQSPGTYSVSNDRPIAEIDSEKFESIVSTATGGGSTRKDRDKEITVPDYDTDIAQFAEKEFNKIKRESTSFFFDLHRRMEGGTGDLDDTLRTSGQIDRSKQDTLTVQHLYGFFKTTQGYSEDRSVELAYNLYTHYCESYKKTGDDQKRKWITRGENYRELTVRWAIEQYDSDRYRKQLRKSTDGETQRRKHLNIYGEPTYGLARFIVDLSVGEYDDYSSEEIQEYVLPQYNYSMTVEEIEVLVQLVNTHTNMSYDTPRVTNSGCLDLESLYPTKSEVLDFCERVELTYKGNTETSFDTAMKELQQSGEIKVAEIESFERYVVYPSDYPDPPNANSVRCGGEECEPITCTGDRLKSVNVEIEVGE